MAYRAFMVVYSEHGPNVPAAEYHDWYNNVHIPGLLEMPVYQTLTRWEAVDGQKPGFAASYDMPSYEAFVEALPGMWKKWSGPEMEMMETFELMERRNYSVYEGSVPPPSALYDPKKPADYVSFVSMEVRPEDEEEFNKWYDEEHIPMLTKVPGWVRSRRFVLREAWQMGTSVQEQKPMPKYLAMHEWASGNVLETPELKAAISTPLSQKVMDNALVKERRLFKVLRTWERK